MSATDAAARADTLPTHAAMRPRSGRVIRACEGRGIGRAHSHGPHAPRVAACGRVRYFVPCR